MRCVYAVAEISEESSAEALGNKDIQRKLGRKTASFPVFRPPKEPSPGGFSGSSCKIFRLKIKNSLFVAEAGLVGDIPTGVFR